jgi:6-phosphofructokinase 1
MPANTAIKSLGVCRFDSPLPLNTTIGDDLGNFTPDEQRVRRDILVPSDDGDLTFEKAGPRQKLFFDPPATRAAIVTCGGLCPGLNNVIRSVVVALQLNYGVNEVLGIRYGYHGLSPDGQPPIKLTLEAVDGIDKKGGSILGSSRGTPTSQVMADFLDRQKIDILFCVGGDGTQRGAHALHEEIERRGSKIAIVGIPKTIDNDIQLCDQTFGFATAIDMARNVLDCAHAESKGVQNGVGLVKLMGRDSGFIAVGATLASQEVNFTLIPEQKFTLQGERGFLAALEQRLITRKHAVIALAEGAGQHLFTPSSQACDASGNVKFQDIGPFMKQEISAHFAKRGIPAEVKYIDPSYIIRSVPANCTDSLLCDSLARRAVHAAMAGKTDVLMAVLHHTFIHVPISLATAKRRQVNLEGEGWSSVLAATGQPKDFV